MATKRLLQNLLTKIADLFLKQDDFWLLEKLSDTAYFALYGTFYLRNQYVESDVFDNFALCVLQECEGLLCRPYKATLRLFCLAPKARIDQLFGMLSRRAQRLF